MVYVPREGEESEGDEWTPSKSSQAFPPRFRDLAALGTGEWLGIHGELKSLLFGAASQARRSSESAS